MKTDYAAMEDDALLACYYKRGEEAAFTELMGRHTPTLMRYVGGMLGVDSGLVDDVFQETWIRVIKNEGKWHGGNFRAWLMRIAHNVTVDLLRRIKPTLSLDAENDAGEPMGHSIASTECGPDSILEGIEVSEYVKQQVLELPELQREVFLLRVVEEMSFKEIAESLQIPLNTALGRMHYAVNKLRTELSEHPEEWSRGGRV